MTKKAILTHPITLEVSATEGGLFEELVEIKEFPDLGSAPDAIDVTTLKDMQVSNIPGIINNGEMTFISNYTSENYTVVKDVARTELYYKINFGTDGVDGAFGWKGSHEVNILGAGTNSPVDMQLTVYAESKIQEFIKMVLANETITVAELATSDESPTLTPADATITYTIADEAVATVDASGVVTGVSAGSTTLTILATDEDYASIKKVVPVTVTT